MERLSHAAHRLISSFGMKVALLGFVLSYEQAIPSSATRSVIRAESALRCSTFSSSSTHFSHMTNSERSSGRN